MDKILDDAGLSALRERFQEERIDPEIVISMSDEELSRLGVSTMGDRIRLRSACRGKGGFEVENTSPSISTVSAATVASERARLFNPRQRGSNRKRKAPQRSGRTWTAQFICLANRLQTVIPSASEKQTLNDAGLGLKKIKFSAEDDETQVAEKIMSKDIVNDETLGFPQLKEGGGFELLQCQSSSRQLTMIKCHWSAKDLKANLGAQSKIYIRPIQKNLSTESKKPGSVNHITQACEMCQKEFPMHELRNHLYTCTSGLFDSDSGEGIVSATESGCEERSAAVTIEAEGTSAINANVHVEGNVGGSNTAPEVINLENICENVNTVEEIMPNMEGKAGIDSVIDVIVDYCHTSNTFTTKEVVRLLQTRLIRGRSLEVESEDVCPEGATNYILVDRHNLLETGIEEISGLEDPLLTLDVQFYGEVNQ